MSHLLQLRKTDLRRPLNYSKDALLNAAWVKGLLDNGWYLHNQFTGLPDTWHMEDFPMSESLHLLIMKGIGLFTRDYAKILNLYYLLTFPLITLTSLFVFRHFKLSYPAAMLASILFALHPYHFVRNQAHLFLGAYYLIPLVVMVACWIYTTEPLLFARRSEAGTLRSGGFSLPSVASLAICLLVASAGIYYAFFACFFFLVAGISASLARKTWYPVCAASALAVVITLGGMANLAPTFLYQYKHGKNPEVARRLLGEAELYGLKPVQLLLPITNHRVPSLARLKQTYVTAPCTRVEVESSMGLTASMGFLVLVGLIFYRRALPLQAKPQATDQLPLWDALCLFNAAGVLLATVGGFGMVLSLAGLTSIRAYDRMSVYIGFFSLFAIGLTWQWLWQKYAQSLTTRCLLWALCGLLVWLAVLDQTPKTHLVDHALIRREFDSDADFVRMVEASVPEGSMVFQLPYHPFPEAGPLYNMRPYELFKGYLHSKRLRWSYGAMKERWADRWQHEVSEMGVHDQLHVLACAGFNGIYVDRNGYADHGAEVESKLRGVLGSAPLVSNNQRLSFFNLTEYRQQLRAKYTATQWAAKRDRAFHLIAVEWREGFYQAEGAPPWIGRWCLSEGSLWLHNPSNEPAAVNLRIAFTTIDDRPFCVKMESTLLSEKTVQVSARLRDFCKTIVVPPGSHLIRLSCDIPPFVYPGDPRTLVFKVNKFEMTLSDD
jgi:phosphoglycerol transferase